MIKTLKIATACDTVAWFLGDQDGWRLMEPYIIRSMRKNKINKITFWTHDNGLYEIGRCYYK